MKTQRATTKTSDTDVTLDIEMVLTNFIIASFSGVFAYMGYHADIALLFFFNVGVSSICMFMAYYFIYEYRLNKRDSELKKQREAQIHKPYTSAYYDHYDYYQC